MGRPRTCLSAGHLRKMLCVSTASPLTAAARAWAAERPQGKAGLSERQSSAQNKCEPWRQAPVNGTISSSAGALHGPGSLGDTGALVTPAEPQRCKGKGWISLGSSAGLWRTLWEPYPLCPDSRTLSVQGPRAPKHLISRPVR